MNAVHLLEYKKEKSNIPWYPLTGMYFLLLSFLLIGGLVIIFLCADWIGLLSQTEAGN